MFRYLLAALVCGLFLCVFCLPLAAAEPAGHLSDSEIQTALALAAAVTDCQCNIGQPCICKTCDCAADKCTCKPCDGKIGQSSATSGVQYSDNDIANRLRAICNDIHCASPAGELTANRIASQIKDIANEIDHANTSSAVSAATEYELVPVTVCGPNGCQTTYQRVAKGTAATTTTTTTAESSGGFLSRKPVRTFLSRIFGGRLRGGCGG